LDEYCKLCNLNDVCAFIHSYGESFEVFRNVTQLNPQIICNVIHAFSYSVLRKTNLNSSNLSPIILPTNKSYFSLRIL
jgi:hypothetical protein